MKKTALLAATLLAAFGLVAVGGPTLQPPSASSLPVGLCPSVNGPTTFTYTCDYVGQPQTFTVPAGVFNVTVDAYGAQGGQGLNSAASSGGLGAVAHATVLAVMPGEVLTILVGGHGTDGTLSSVGAGGFNGGGAGGAGQTGTGAGGGGGASEVRRGGTGLVVAAGGGGSGESGGAGGAGGQSGLNGGGTTGSTGGGGFSGGNGGAGGAGQGTGQAGTNGTANQGGKGGDANFNGGGGGGGGVLGGGGGGGSSTNVGGGGGGGSSTGPAGTTFVTGGRSGDGKVVISWGFCNAPVESPPGTVTVTCPFAQAAQSLSVPADVWNLKVDAYGAAGGKSDVGAATGARGALAHTDALSATPGEVLPVVVGGRGGDGTTSVIGAVSTPASGGAGGFNGGGVGGAGVQLTSDVHGGGGGGGASYVRRNSNPLLIAGGGGGAGAGTAGVGGTGGASGQNGANGAPGLVAGGTGAGPALQGFGGAGSNGPASNGKDGSAGLGGTGGGADPGNGGGGGGGGVFGGGGGGGSTSFDAAGGGGGSSAGFAGTTFTSGADAASSGNGKIVFTYLLATPCGNGVESPPGTITVTCSLVDHAQTWTPPAGVTSATFTLDGAAGGIRSVNAGGNGGHTGATVAVSSSTTYHIAVGAKGGPDNSGSAVGRLALTGVGGAPGGGYAGVFCADPGCGSGFSAGGGGGASIVSTGLISTDVSNWVLAAGGGGGGADGGPGGAGGGTTGGTGPAAGSGAGGTQTCATHLTGGDGQSGQGSGGGGAGYCGGAGGLGGGPGGGGSGFISTSPGVTGLMGPGSNTGNGVVTISYLNPIPSTITTVTSTANPSVFGQVLTFTAKVCPSSGTTAPTGTVQFRIDGTNFGSAVTLGAGDVNHCATATSGSIASLLPATHTVGAVYTHTGNFQDSSGSLNQVVNCASNRPSTSSNVSISGGSTCISGAAITGNVSISGGASVAIVGSSVKNLTVSGGGVLAVCGTTVTGSLFVSGDTGFVLVGDTVDDGCSGNDLRGTTTLGSNSGGLELGSNRIASNVSVTNTTGAGPFADDAQAVIRANNITGNLFCSGNVPPPSHITQPNTVSGSRSGQCGAAGF